MSELDLDNLLEPVSSTDPTGEDLEYDPNFQEMLIAANGQPERVMGDAVVPAVEPDWKRVIELGVDLLARSKDIRTAIVLCQALIHTKGLLGLDPGIALTRRLLEEYWDSVHPQLDADDNNDPTARMSALLNLCDRDSLLLPVRAAPLATSRTFGAISLRDVEISKGESSEHADTDAASQDSSTINAAFLDCEIDQLRSTARAVSNTLSNVKAIETLVAQRIGSAEAPDLAPMRNLLAVADGLLREKVAERSEEADGEPADAADSGELTQAATGEQQPAARAVRVDSQIAGRDDVVRMLDKLCDYYARNEPSSPVPLLLKRARGLVTKDFMGIVQDLAPEALAQIEKIRGPQGES